MSGIFSCDWIQQNSNMCQFLYNANETCAKFSWSHFYLTLTAIPTSPFTQELLAHPKSRLSVAHLVFGIVVAVIFRPTVWIFCVSSFSVAHLVFGIVVAVIFRSTVWIFVSPFHETLWKELSLVGKNCLLLTHKNGLSYWLGKEGNIRQLLDHITLPNWYVCFSM